MNAPVDPATLAKVSLDDKYTLERGRVFLTGTRHSSGCCCCSASATCARG
jgi:hypothetical protein